MKVWLYLIGILLISCAQNPEPSLYTESQLSTLRWNSSALPIALKISDAFDPAAITLTSSMEDVWENAANLDFFQAFQTIPNKQFATLEEY